jgi:anti-anti-sigma factor
MSNVELERIDGVQVARPRGDIDAANTAVVDETLVQSLEPEGDCLVLDLSETRYLDSAALDMLFRLSDRLRQRRGRMHLVIPGDSPLSRLVAIVAMPEVIPVHATVTEALAVCARHRDEQSGPAPTAPGPESEHTRELPGDAYTK